MLRHLIGQRGQPEKYAKRIAETGHFAPWDPTTHILPGDYGYMAHGVFKCVGPLSGNNYTYGFQATGASHGALKSVGLITAGVTGGTNAGAPLDTVKVGGTATYRSTRRDEVLLVMRASVSWTLDNTEALLRQIQSRIEEFPLNTVIASEVTATDGGFRVITSAANQSFHIGVNGQGQDPTLSIDGNVAAEFGRTSAAGEVTSFWAHAAADYKPSTKEPPGPAEACMPVFRDGYRVARRYWGLLGHGSLLRTLGGQAVLVYPAEHDQSDFRPDHTGLEGLGPLPDPASRADLESIKRLDVWDLFEPVGADEVVEEFALISDALVHPA